MKINFQKISLPLSVLFFIAVCVAFFFLFRMINKNNDIAEQKLTEWNIEAARRDEIKLLNNSIAAIEGEKTLLETHFIQSSNIVPFLDTIESMGDGAGAEAEVSSVDILKDNSGLLVGVYVSGNFDAVYRFLTLLENSSYELEFLSMNIETGAILDPTKKVAAVPKWTATFKIKLLSFIK